MSEKRLDLIRPYYAEMIDTPLYNFIIINELPEEQRTAFELFIEGQPQPVPFPDAKIDCAYESDYLIWYEQWINGKIPVKTNND